MFWEAAKTELAADNSHIYQCIIFLYETGVVRYHIEE